MAADIYQVPDLEQGTFHRTEQIIKKSRFITSIAHTSSVEEAKAFIDTIKAEFSDATHNCWAYNAGAACSTAQIGASDDGEPHGTAGKPMLNVLVHSDIGELTAVVTRYFGGTLLGTGGLVKAYSSSVKQGLETLPLCERMIVEKLSFTVEHKFIGQIQRLLPDYRAKIIHQEFLMDVTMELALPEQLIDQLKEKLINLTAGAILFEE